jgi:HK97 family phage prohead protease
MEVKQLRVHAELKADEQGVIEGYGSIFGNVDSYGDIVAKGAFSRTLGEAEKSRMPAMLWQHNPDEPIGVWQTMREDAKGLFVRGQLADTQRGREALTLVKMGALTGLSIGYSTVKFEYDQSKDIRTLTDVNLWEVSPVTFPANDKARISGVKAAEMTEREIEEILRDAGFSRKEAKAFIAEGFRGLRCRDGGPEIPDELHAPLKALLNFPQTR